MKRDYWTVTHLDDVEETAAPYISYKDENFAVLLFKCLEPACIWLYNHSKDECWECSFDQLMNEFSEAKEHAYEKLNERFKISLAAMVDREYETVEINYKMQGFSEINQEKAQLEVLIYSCQSEQYWEFLFDEVVGVIQKAKDRLVDEGYVWNNGGIVAKRNKIEDESLQEVNKRGQEILDSILVHPKRFDQHRMTGRYGEVLDIRTPDHRGARYSLEVEFLDFLECENSGIKDQKDKFELICTAMPDREHQAVEIFDDKWQFVEISEEIEDELLVQIYSYQEKHYWEYSYKEFVDIMVRAMQFLKNTYECKDKNMIKNNFEFKKSKTADEGLPSLEVHVENVMFAELFERDGEVIVRFYSHPSKEWWELYYDDMMEALHKAKEVLLDRM